MKEKLLRVLHLLQDTDEKNPLNASQIVERLETRYSICGVNRHSIYQDILVLEKCGYPIKRCDDHRQGWYIQNHLFEDWEISILLDAMMQSKCLTGEEVKNLRDKLLNTTGERGRKRFNKLSKALPPARPEGGKRMGNYIEAMLEAMYTGHKIEFQYTELDEYLRPRLRKEGRIYEMSLYAMYWGGNTYYLMGMHDHHNELTHYRLDRIRNLHISEKKEIPAQQRLGEDAVVVIQKKIASQVDHYGGEDTRIVLEYNPGQIENGILYDFVGENVRIQKLKDGRMRASFNKQDSVTLRGWLMRYCAMFEVVEPENIRTEVVANLQKGMERYNRMR